MNHFESSSKLMEQVPPTTFDSCLGGGHVVEHMLNVQEFCKSRIEEILMLSEALKESPFRGQAFQRLPKHMRRRQMSHYIKRLPHRLRNNYLACLKGEMPPPPKRPSRKYRRRPKNLLLEYNRRQKSNVWLETHIWHSKRFHMVSKWGYKLPEKPTSKSYRACYRAATQHCFLSDISFYNCLELKGLESKLLDSLQKCTSPNNGLTFAAKMFENGCREGSLALFHPLSYPYGAIGRVSFLWKPLEEAEENRCIWIFTHPLIFDEVFLMFKALFDLCKSEVVAQPSSADVTEEEKEEKNRAKEKKGKELKSKKSNKEEIKLEPRSIQYERAPKYMTADGSVCMTLLKDTMNRFRLIGPLSLNVISKAFDVNLTLISPLPQSENSPVRKESEINLKRSYSESFGDDSDKAIKKIKADSNEDVSEYNSTEDECNVWWRKYYDNEFHRKCLEKQREFYKSLEKYISPSDLPPDSVFSLVVKDPRLTLPVKRVKCTTETQSVCSLPPISVDTSLCHSPLWDSNIRDEVSFTKITTCEINYARSKLIVPGTNIGNVLAENKQASIPLIVVQRTGVNPTDYFDRNGNCSGFDIIVPAGWGMPVWLSLIYRGARIGGLREMEALALETNSLTEHLQPDSEAGELENLEKCKNLRIKYFKLPPNKRPNFIKLGVRNPFYFPWKVLIKDWRLRSHPSEGENSDIRFYVLRDRKKLLELNGIFQNLRKMLKTKTNSELISTFEEDEMDCLIPVCVETKGKGIPEEFAMVCLPTVQDIHGFKTNGPSPVEPPQIDENEDRRKLLKLEHSRLLRSLKRKRKKDRMKKEEEDPEKLPGKLDNVQNEETEISSSKDVDEYNVKIKRLWFEDPKNIKSVIDTCSRTIIGYVVLGGFSYTRTRGLGLGYVTLRGLLHFLKTCYDEKSQPFALYRNANNLKYRFGYLRICMN